ncbi:hypothetical protein M0R45_026112 [Rubus argutus]|uniref:Secreted protein n=1 Tax=Rubus argutus TaxID=59490 RepID=A0AAW1WYC6_RUBAR
MSPLATSIPAGFPILLSAHAACSSLPLPLALGAVNRAALFPDHAANHTELPRLRRVDPVPTAQSTRSPSLPPLCRLPCRHCPANTAPPLQ